MTRLVLEVAKEERYLFLRKVNSSYSATTRPIAHGDQKANYVQLGFDS